MKTESPIHTPSLSLSVSLLSLLRSTRKHTPCTFANGSIFNLDCYWKQLIIKKACTISYSNIDGKSAANFGSWRVILVTHSFINFSADSVYLNDRVDHLCTQKLSVPSKGIHTKINQSNAIINNLNYVKYLKEYKSLKLLTTSFLFCSLFPHSCGRVSNPKFWFLSTRP